MSKFLLIYGYRDFEYQIVSVNEDWELEYSLYDDSNKKFPIAIIKLTDELIKEISELR